MSFWDILSTAQTNDELKRRVYTVKCHCRNCGWQGSLEFKKGQRAPLHMECPRCECNDVVKA